MQVYIVGDSISLQYGPYLQRYLHDSIGYARKQAAEAARLGMTEADANGGDSAAVLAFLEAKARADEIDADLLLVNCGLHDIRVDPTTGAHQVAIDAYRAKLRAIIALCERVRKPLVWIRTTPCDDAIHNQRQVDFQRFTADCQAYNQVADEVMAAAGVPSLDLYSFTHTLGPDLYADHVHFHPHIQEKQGAFIAGWLMAYAEMMGSPPPKS